MNEEEQKELKFIVPGEEENGTEKKPNKYLKSVEQIWFDALNNNLLNSVHRELTYQQALSIHLRSRQLIKEGTLHPNQLNPKAISNQIEKCYKQQYRKANER